MNALNFSFDNLVFDEALTVFLTVADFLTDLESALVWGSAGSLAAAGLALGATALEAGFLAAGLALGS